MCESVWRDHFLGMRVGWLIRVDAIPTVPIASACPSPTARHVLRSKSHTRHVRSLVGLNYDRLLRARVD